MQIWIYMLRFKEKLAGCTTPQKIVTYNHGFYKASALPPSHHGWIEIEVWSVKFRLGGWVAVLAFYVLLVQSTNTILFIINNVSYETIMIS